MIKCYIVTTKNEHVRDIAVEHVPAVGDKMWVFPGENIEGTRYKVVRRTWKSCWWLRPGWVDVRLVVKRVR